MKKNVKQSAALYAAVVCLSVCLSITGCQHDMGSSQNMGPGKSSQKELTSFVLKNSEDLNLAGAIIGTINQDTKTVNLTIPPAVDKTKLIATFMVSPHAQVFVNGVVQKSGETVQNFSADVVYTVQAEDGSKQDYTVKPVAGTVAEGRKIEKIMFKATKNSDLTKDVIGEFYYPAGWQTKAILGLSFPAGTDATKLNNLIPEFTASHKAELFYDQGTSGTKLESGVTHIDVSIVPNDNNRDFQTGKFITVKAENGQTFLYKVMSEIDLPNAEESDITKYAGSYYGELNSPRLGKNKVVAVFEKEKVTLYTTAKGMSMDYSNVEWEKDGDKVWCVTYKMDKPKVKNLYGKLGFSFEETSGKTNAKGAIMGTSVTLEKGVPFVWTEGCEYSKVNMSL
ncbi:hypothetical protein [Treponema sp.]|uniref:hypothetical protein n=1 Tax=Treponema sp. TaxID=166 RepID=UPI003FA2A64E